MKSFFKDENISHIDFEDKKALIRFHLLKTFMLCQSMFEWKGLPKTIPQRALEMNIQRTGATNFFKWEGEYYQSFGNNSGTLNYNYLPTYSIIANPYIKNFQSKTMKIYYGTEVQGTEQSIKYDLEGVRIVNDALSLGLLPIIDYYSQLLVENVISKKVVTINSRAMNVFIAGDDNMKNSFEEFMKSLKNGDLKAILAKNIMKEAQTLPFSGSSSSARTLSELIEDQQYIKASFYNDLGLNANYNMKRESITSNEAQLNEDALLPNTDHWLKMRREGCQYIKELFGLDISVDFSSAWKQKREEIEEVTEEIAEKALEDENVEEVDEMIDEEVQATEQDDNDESEEEKDE